MYLASALAQPVSDTQEDADVSRAIRIGSRVRLLHVPDSLIHDLPSDEQVEIRSFVGQESRIDDIDAHGFFWVSFGRGEPDPLDQGSWRCSGHSFSVTGDCLELIEGNSE